MPNTFKSQSTQRQIEQQTERVLTWANDRMTEFNERHLRLKDTQPQQRIVLLFFTRSLKTFQAIIQLSEAGFAQNVSILLRSLIELRISLRYILHDPRTASIKASRFVEYKWVLFKKYLSQMESQNRSEIPSDPLLKSLIEERHTILKKVDAFKITHRVKSDRALITWSGRSLRDMAKAVDPELVGVYDTTFRKASTLSHPSVIGDQHHVTFEEDLMLFKPYANGGEDAPPYLTDALSTMLDILQQFIRAFNLTPLPEASRSSTTHAAHTHDESSANETQHPATKNPRLKFDQPSSPIRHQRTQ
jgi:hypothetical protein